MFDNEYSKLLTVILIVVIIVVAGMLCFLGYDVFRKHTLEKDSKDVVSRFENEVINQESSTNVEIPINQVTNEVVNPNVNVNELDVNNNNNNQNSGSSEKVVKYKGYEVIGTIEIPATEIKYPIIKQKDIGIDSLKVAICNLYGELNKPGSNAVLVGHNYRNGTFFSNNKRLAQGDKIYITDLSGKKVTYIISKKYVTSTGDFNYATRDVGDKMAISLSTCTDDSKQRLIIWAEQE